MFEKSNNSRTIKKYWRRKKAKEEARIRMWDNREMFDMYCRLQAKSKRWWDRWAF